MKKLSDADEAGVQAVIALQATAGVAESREQALLGWSKMTAEEKARTMESYDIFFPNRPKRGAR
jgi:hypothetical protein